MIAFARELLCEVVQEVQPLLEQHHAEMVKHRDVIRLDPQWQQYALLEQLGRFVIFTGRDEGKLVAYNAFHVIRHLQSAKFTQAVNDVIYFLPNWRRGFSVLRFLRYCDDELKAQSAQQIVYFCSPENNLAPFLHRLGYADEQTMTAKMI